MKDTDQIIWSEIRDDEGIKEMFYLLAEKASTEWTFFERSSWELRWYPVNPTECLVKRALFEREETKKTGSAPFGMRQVA